MADNNLSLSKKTIKNIFKVSISNIANMLSGLLVAFLLPKIIGVADYGYYKTFTLYAGYIGLFHFGIADGIILEYGGKDYDELEKPKFRVYSRVFILLELAISLTAILIGLVCFKGESRFISICLAVYLVGVNVVTYYQYISQATNRFSELSKRTLLQSTFTCLVIVALWTVYCLSDIKLSYRVYVLITCCIQMVMCLWYLMTYRDITFGMSRQGAWMPEILSLVKLGIPLLVANLVQNLLLNIDRQFVSVLFDTDTYAVYSFGYNVLSLITLVTSAIAVVLYPTLKRTNPDKLSKEYPTMVAFVLSMIFTACVIFFPFCEFVKWFLPQYAGSIQIVRIILPGFAVSSSVTIVMQNYYKVLGKTVHFFAVSLAVLTLSCLANGLCYRIWGSTQSISMASVSVILIWYVVTDLVLIGRIQYENTKNLVYLLMMGIVFYFTTAINSLIIGAFTYIVICVLITGIFYGKQIYHFISDVLKNADSWMD